MDLMKRLLYLMIAIFALVLAACGGSDGTSNEAADTNIEAEESEADTEDDTTENEESDGNHANEEIELPSILPSDMPLPDDAILGRFSDTEDDGMISVNTSKTLEDLEVLYDDYLDGNTILGEVDKYAYDDAGDDVIEYVIDNEEIFFLIHLSERDDHRAVHIRMIKLD